MGGGSCSKKSRERPFSVTVPCCGVPVAALARLALPTVLSVVVGFLQSCGLGFAKVESDPHLRLSARGVQKCSLGGTMPAEPVFFSLRKKNAPNPSIFELCWVVRVASHQGGGWKQLFGVQTLRDYFYWKMHDYFFSGNYPPPPAVWYGPVPASSPGCTHGGGGGLGACRDAPWAPPPGVADPPAVGPVTEHPVVLQLGGSSPELLERACTLAAPPGHGWWSVPPPVAPQYPRPLWGNESGACGPVPFGRGYDIWSLGQHCPAFHMGTTH